jgi:hypothetical protein
VLKDIEVGTVLKVKVGEAVKTAKVRKIAPPGGSFTMLTLDIDGDVGFCVAHVDELANG